MQAANEDNPALRNEIEAEISGLNIETIELLLKSYTDFFSHWLIKPNNKKLFRINRNRAQNSTADAPLNRIYRRSITYPAFPVVFR